MTSIKFVSIWDGHISATSTAELDLATGEIKNIGPSDLSPNQQETLKNLDLQIVEYNGRRYDVIEGHNGFDYAVDLNQ